MYGIGTKETPEKCVMNDGQKPFDEKLFANSYQNDENSGKKDFM